MEAIWAREGGGEKFFLAHIKYEHFATYTKRKIIKLFIVVCMKYMKFVIKFIKIHMG